MEDNIQWVDPEGNSNSMTITEATYGDKVITVIAVPCDVVMNKEEPWDIIPLLDGNGAYIAICIDYLQNLQEGAPDQFLAGLSVGIFVGELLANALAELQFHA